MQTTLLGLAIAIIVALLAALVGPLLIDWGSHRALFEAEASRLVGLNVRVTGDIDARLLPSPRLTLHAIEIEGGNTDKIRARTLGIEFALGPLMRGEWRATELNLAGPQISLGLDASGHLQAPNVTVAFNPDGLAIDRLSIEDGKVTLADAASGASVTLERVRFNGEARSLVGPFRGEGAVTIGGELYPFRIAAGRYGEDGALKLHANIDPVNRPLSIEADGTLALAGGQPRFEGSWSMARPVGIGLRGKALITQPWRLSGAIKASAQSALMEQVEFQYGSADRGLKLTGLADFKFGTRPRFDGLLSGRQIDLDRALTDGDGTRLLPAAAIRQLADLGGAAFRPAIPIHIGVGIDQITLGGNVIANLRGDIGSDAQGWNLDRFEFRAPGFTQVRLAGHLAVVAGGAAFVGPAEIDAGDPKALANWLAGRVETAQSELRPLNLRGELAVASDKVAIERLKAEFDRKAIAGRLAYVFAAENRSAKLDAELNAAELDVDAALGFGNALLAGADIARPYDMTIAVDIGRATIAGMAARDASARLKVDGDGLQIDRLSVADLGGAAFSVSGRIVTAPSPQGSMRFALDAPDMTPVMALLARLAPEAARSLAPRAPLLAPAKLRATLTIDGAAPSPQAKLAIDGNLGKVRVALNGQANADPIALSVGDMRLDGKFEADDGKALAAMWGLDRMVTVNTGPGTLTVNASGPARGEQQVDARLTAGGLEARASGTVRLFADVPSAALRATIVRADAAPLRGTGGGRAALPVTFAGSVALTPTNLSLADINASIAGAALRGKLEVTLARPHRLQGEIEADNIDGGSLIAAAVGMPAMGTAGNNAAWAWSAETFADGAFGVFGVFAGEVALKARQFDIPPQLMAREFRATARLGGGEFTFDDMTGDVGGGRFAGRISFRAAQNGVTARAKISLTGAAAGALLGSPARPPLTGSLGLAAEVEGTGLSPVALIGSLHGSGKIALADAQFAGLDPRAFDAATHAVDQGLAINTVRIAAVVNKALDSGPLVVKRADGAIAISAGQARLSNVTAEGKDARVSLNGNLDLIDGSIDARLVLSGANQASKPDVLPGIIMTLKGPITAPSRNIDVSALTAWLTLRAVENQVKQLQAIENGSPPAAPPPRPKIERPKSERAPALPAPIDIRPLPAPARAKQPPPPSFGPQN